MLMETRPRIALGILARIYLGITIGIPIEILQKKKHHRKSYMNLGHSSRYWNSS